MYQASVTLLCYLTKRRWGQLIASAYLEEGEIYMRRYRILLLVLLASILVNHVCCAESTDEDTNNYVSIASQAVYVEENHTVRDNRLSASLYISNHEIWFSGTSPEGKPWLICTNDRGEILLAKTLEDAPGKRVYVRALSKVEDTLL